MWKCRNDRINKFTPLGSVFQKTLDCNQSQTDGEGKVQLNVKPGPCFWSNHFSGNEITSSLHTIAIFSVVPESPTTVFPSVALETRLVLGPQISNQMHFSFEADKNLVRQASTSMLHDSWWKQWEQEVNFSIEVDAKASGRMRVGALSYPRVRSMRITQSLGRFAGSTIDLDPLRVWSQR